MATHHHYGAPAPGLAVPQRAPVLSAGLAPLVAPGPAAAGLIAHLKGEARELGSGAGFKGQTQNDGTDSQAGDYGTQADAERKEVARVTALAACWNLVSPERPDLRAVMALLLRMGTSV